MAFPSSTLRSQSETDLARTLTSTPCNQSTVDLRTLSNTPCSQSTPDLAGTLANTPRQQGLAPKSVDKQVASPSSPEKTAADLENGVSDNYDSVPVWRRWVILFVTSWVTFVVTFSSTSLFSAAYNIAEDFGTTPAQVYAASGGLLICMGISSFVWGPVEIIFGRRTAYTWCIFVLVLTTIGSGLARSWPIFVAMRILAGFEGTYFHVTGQAILAEHFRPTQRGMATGVFLCGTATGPAFGPCVAGIIMQYTDWRVVIWLQVGMGVVSLLLSMIFLPSTPGHTGLFGEKAPTRDIMASLSPVPVLRLLPYPNVLLTDLSCGLLSWSQYFLLAAPRTVITKRFHLDGLGLGLFYLALAGGFLLGTVAGGKWSDHTVRKWIDRRNGIRLPQDRLNAGMWAFFLVIPAAQLTYGWGMECDSCATNLPGLALPVVSGFLTAAGLLAAFASLNTYCSEVFPAKRREVIVSKYLVQYIFGASASAASVPLIEAVGYGVASTIGKPMSSLKHDSLLTKQV